MAIESFSTSDLTPPLVREVEEFLDGQQTSHPFQFPQWHPDARLLLRRQQGRICWTGTFSVYSPLGRKLPWIRAAVANRGPVCDDLAVWKTATEELVEHFQSERVCFVEVAPDRIHGLEGESGAVEDWKTLPEQRASLRLDLSPSEDAIFANFRKNSRYEVRRAERDGSSVSAASNPSEIEEFLRLYSHLATRKGFPADPVEPMRKRIRWLIESEARGALLLARVGGVACGGAVIARAGKRCWYIWGATDTDQPTNVGHLVQWRALQWARNHGCTEYDFGGYTPGATSGPAWFKQGFGGTAVYFVPSQRRVLRALQHRIYSLLSRTK